METGIELIAKERQRQVEVEGWSAEQDDEQSDMGLAMAGASYVLDVASRESGEHESWKKKYDQYSNRVWPWDEDWFRPTPKDPIRQLVKAGALIAAEIDRLQRIK